MQYGHIYTAFCIIIKLKVMIWKLHTIKNFNVRTFNVNIVNIVMYCIVLGQSWLLK